MRLLLHTASCVPKQRRVKVVRQPGVYCLLCGTHARGESIYVKYLSVNIYVRVFICARAGISADTCDSDFLQDEKGANLQERFFVFNLATKKNSTFSM